MDETTPSNMIKYIGKNKAYKPAHMDYANGVFDYGDWGDVWFIKNLRPCMLNYNGTVAYNLDKDDYTKRANGTASDVANVNFGGNAMVGIPTVWIKVDTTAPRKPKFYFADHQVDSSYHAYAHHDDNGNIMPYTYMPAYNGWVDSSNRLRSLSGKELPAGNQMIDANWFTRAKNNNPSGFTGWDIEKFVDRQLINLLLLLIGRTTDGHEAFGWGNVNGNVVHADDSNSSGVLNTGTLNDKGMFYGYDTNTAPNKNKAVKVFGIENWWGNGYRTHMGMYFRDGVYYYKLTKGTEDGTTVNGFPSSIMSTTTVSGWKSVSAPTSTGGITDMHIGEFGLIPKAVGGSSRDSKYKGICISTSATGDTRVVEFGGQPSGGWGGMFSTTINLINGTNSDFRHNVAPSCKPNVS